MKQTTNLLSVLFFLLRFSFFIIRSRKLTFERIENRSEMFEDMSNGTAMVKPGKHVKSVNL